MTFSYLYSKFFKKILRGKSIYNSEIDKTAVVNSGSSIVNSRIGKYSYCGYDCALNNVEIGKYCSIADNVFVGGAEHPLEWVSTSPVFQKVGHSGPTKRFCEKELPAIKRTIIGNDVWIGYGVSIKQGVTIGNGAVVATGAVVTKDVQPYEIVGGCPAKHIRYRFTQEIIDGLQETEWWNLSEEQLQKVAEDIDNPRLFVEKLKSVK